ncbi:L,D-transpeptidase family protein [Streptosporangiaceae bacterium NEAU-GS5]|nr:L,D-transpeptidase family protein [Streptosporangiaceae bacterium NEAU-GS5]
MVRRAGALALVIAASTTACSSSTNAGPQKAAATPVAAVNLSVYPLDGATKLPPEAPVYVAVANGELASVTLEAAGKPVAGRYSADRSKWRPSRPLLPGTAYEVTARLLDGTVKTSHFSTVKAKKTFAIQHIVPDKQETGLTVGVGMPIMVTFDQDVADRVSVERNLIVQASKPVEGAWHWFDNRNVSFRPKNYWPAYTKVKFMARLSGVRGADGMYAAKDYAREFKIGRSQISVANTDTHHMRIRRNGKFIRDVPISAGRGGEWKYYTTNGIHLAMSREPVTIMTSPGIGPGSPGYYQETVYNTVRISNSGEYVHSAPWSVGSQGNSNVSHGCVNVSPENARWFIDNTLIGDPIIVKGTPRNLEPTNGWGHWQENWKEWLKWSRLRAADTDPLSSK